MSAGGVWGQKKDSAKPENKPGATNKVNGQVRPKSNEDAKKGLPVLKPQNGKLAPSPKRNAQKNDTAKPKIDSINPKSKGLLKKSDSKSRLADSTKPTATRPAIPKIKTTSKDLSLLVNDSSLKNQRQNSGPLASIRLDSGQQKSFHLIQDKRLQIQKILMGHPYFGFGIKAIISPYSKREPKPRKDIYFYALAGLMLMFAGFKTTFSKYFDDLMTLFFKRTLKQRQLQQQLSQDTLPSFLFNFLFVLVAGFYLALMVEQLSTIDLSYPFWKLFPMAILLVGAVYLAKYLLLKMFGWLFNLQSLTDAYIFLIFLVNKIIIIFLLPVIMLASLGETRLRTIIWTLSWILLGTLFFYRFIVAIRLARKNARISVFHFIIYFLAFEILPALAIYKFILLFLSRNDVPLHPI